MFADSPDFHDPAPPIELHQLALIIDATATQIACLTTLFDILGDPTYQPETSEHHIELGSTRRWFGNPEWFTFLSRASALMGYSGAFSLTPAAFSPSHTVHSSSAESASTSDDVTPRGIHTS